MNHQELVRLALFAGIPLFGFGLPLVLHRYWPGGRIKELNRALSRAELSVDAASRARLERQAARRRLWGALSFGSAFTLATPLAWIVLPDAFEKIAPFVGLAAAALGVSVGMALSALYLVEPSVAPVRLSALQPHGLRDYLRGYELAIQAVCGLVGLAGLVGGILLVLRDDSAHDFGGWVDIGFGVLAGGAALTAFVLERRLLATPAAAGNESQLIVNDVILAIGLRDLVGVAALTTYGAGYAALIAINTNFWLIQLYCCAFLFIYVPFFNGRLAPDLTPVAHRLAAKPVTQAT